jgi:hypothetical protein
MAEVRSRDDTCRPALRREVIIPKANDGLAFHRRVAILSVLVALLAGSLDAMLWREAQRRADQTQVEADIAAQRAALVDDYEARRAAGEVPYHGDFDVDLDEVTFCGGSDLR